MKLTALALVLSCVLTSGCGTSARQALMRADQRWHAATGIRAKWPRIVQVRYGTFDCGDDKQVTGCHEGGAVDGVTIDVSRPDKEIERTAVHEWGHRLGAEHTGRAGVMGPKTGTPAAYCISWFDVDAVCSMNDCEWERPECP